MTTMPGSELYLPINSASKASENDFITYLDNEEEQVEDEVVYRKTKEITETSEGVFTVRLGVNATPDAQVELIFDETVGDIIKGQGTGLLNFEYISNGDFTMTGEYTLSKGDYLFTMLNLVNKPFRLEPGGKIRWNGDPFDAILDLDAYYELRAPLYDLMPTSPNAEELKKRFPVQCHMMLSEKLLQPNIEFDIVLPTADVETKRSVESIINTKDELSRQVISLLAMNRFYTPDYMRASMTDQNNTAQSQAAAVTASEFLSSQLSNWLSQISEDVDLGVHYRPGDNTYTNTEVELMLGTQLWNDRIEFNSNVGYRDNQATTSNPNASNFVGDFEVLVKLNQQYHLKAYSRTNDNIFYETSPTTQGAGIIYKEEFNNWQDFWDTKRKRKEERKRKREEKRAQKRGDATRVDEED